MLLNIRILPNIDDSYNFSASDFPSERIWLMLPNWEIAIKIVTFIPVILLGVIGNLIILNIIIRNRSLRTPTNLLIANMATADFLTILVSPIMFMFHDFYQNYQLGAYGCKLEGFSQGALLITAVLNLCAVSYDRLTAIVLPIEARLTLRGAKIVMIITWIVGLVLSAPLAIYRTYVEREWKNFIETYCKENPIILPKYWHVLIAALVWFPLGVMIISYSAIFRKLDRYEKQVLKREHPLCVSYKTKVAKTLFIVVVTFIILRTPFTVLVFLRNDKLIRDSASDLGASFEALWYASHYLIFVNAAINPVIYGLNNDNFRRAYNQTPIFRCYRTKVKKSEPIYNYGISFIRICYENIKTKNGESRFSGVKSLLVLKKNNNKACDGSKSTRTTNLRHVSKIEENMENKSINKKSADADANYIKINLENINNLSSHKDSIQGNQFI